MLRTGCPTPSCLMSTCFHCPADLTLIPVGPQAVTSGYLHKPLLHSLALTIWSPQEPSACPKRTYLVCFPSPPSEDRAYICIPTINSEALGFSNQIQIPAHTRLLTILTGHSKPSSGLQRHGTSTWYPNIHAGGKKTKPKQTKNHTHKNKPRERRGMGL